MLQKREASASLFLSANWLIDLANAYRLRHSCESGNDGNIWVTSAANLSTSTPLDAEATKQNDL